MQQTVYVDLYFLVNFSMDLLCLWITASLMHRRTSRWRTLLAATIGGAYAVCSLLLSLTGVIGFLSDALVAALLTLLCFKDRRTTLSRTLVCIPIFLFVSMAVGGIMTALYSLLNRLDLPFDALSGDSLSVWSFALLSAIAGLATVRGGRFMGFSQKTHSVTVKAVLFGNSVTLRALVDSGNLLRDPVSGKSVIVADLERLAPHLPRDLVRACRAQSPTDFLSTYEHARRVRPIPTATATGASLLLAIVPDSLTVLDGNHSYSADYLIAPAPLDASAAGFDAVIALS